MPRVLSYLRRLPDSDYAQIETAADVYFRAIGELLKQGLLHSDDARLPGWGDHQPPGAPHAQNVREAWKLLGAIAYAMTCRQIRQMDPTSGTLLLVPNFDRIDAGQFEDFEAELEQRYRSKAKAGLAQDWTALAALNDILEHGVFDTDLEGLEEVQFRNRSLQEFCVRTTWRGTRSARTPTGWSAGSTSSTLPRPRSITMSGNSCVRCRSRPDGPAIG